MNNFLDNESIIYNEYRNIYQQEYEFNIRDVPIFLNIIIINININ